MGLIPPDQIMLTIVIIVIIDVIDTIIINIIIIVNDSVITFLHFTFSVSFSFSVNSVPVSPSPDGHICQKPGLVWNWKLSHPNISYKYPVKPLKDISNLMQQQLLEKSASATFFFGHFSCFSGKDLFKTHTCISSGSPSYFRAAPR